MKRQRRFRRPAVNRARVTSIPVGPSASSRWRERIEREKAEERRWGGWEQSLMIGILTAFFCGIAVSIAFEMSGDPATSVLALVMAGACVGVFLWSFFDPLQAWIAAGAFVLAALIALALIDRKLALSVGLPVLYVWISKLHAQLRETRSRGS